MRGFWKLAFVEFKLFLREPSAFFFTLVFPLMMLFMFGTVFGNDPKLPGGFGTVDVSVPAYTAMIICTSGIMSLTIIISSQREMSILRRLQTTPLKPLAILSAQVVVLFSMATFGMLMLVVAAKVVYGMRFGGSVPTVIFAFVLSSMSFYAFGFVLASVLPTARTAMVLAQTFYYPMLFLSGAAIPKWVLPQAVQKYGQILPLTHVVNMLTGLWMGQPLVDHIKEMLILGGILILGVIISARTFRWE